jgi:hypothetical protein
LISATRRGRRCARSVREAPFLDDVDPGLGEELQRLLGAGADSQLAEGVFDLKLVEPCWCSDPSCASFYAVGRFDLAWVWRRRARTLTVRVEPLLGVDVVGGRIIAVEVSGRPGLRAVLRALPAEGR